MEQFAPTMVRTILSVGRDLRRGFDFVTHHALIHFHGISLYRVRPTRCRNGPAFASIARLGGCPSE
ncbi:hypothetical protein MPC4_340005 [Methylocella tundrae]|uniref:Uncharacterized protein n=1 Tax=Methylocella tundrae TaxID=227605 RepID=A0A8B6M8A2_METTU|nr:hypothetical protein MPC1_12620002 [Methylocella tundrae]VTZ51249.1 hypothetical protein MPC4_340005 [Methylocella tundrae]